jgi:hypothetical protein
MAVLFIRGVDPSRAHDSWETQQSLSVVAKVKYKSSISSRLLAPFLAPLLTSTFTGTG